MIPDQERVLHPNDQIKNIYLIRSGFVQVFDRFYNFLSEQSEGSFFGDYQCMLDLNASNIYKVFSKSRFEKTKST